MHLQQNKQVVDRNQYYQCFKIYDHYSKSKMADGHHLEF